MYPKVLIRLRDGICVANNTDGELSSTLTSYGNTGIQEKHWKKPFGLRRPHAVSGLKWQRQMYQHVPYSRAFFHCHL